MNLKNFRLGKHPMEEQERDNSNLEYKFSFVFVTPIVIYI